MNKDDYEAALDRANEMAGFADKRWNRRFVKALDKLGLKLVFLNPVPREDGCDYMAPMPWSEGWQYQYPSWVIPKEP